jgi:hypothetical protein
MKNIIVKHSDYKISSDCLCGLFDFLKRNLLVLFLITTLATSNYCQEEQLKEVNQLKNQEFMKRYEKWLPERIISDPSSTSNNPPVPDPTKTIYFFGEMYKQKDKNIRWGSMFIYCYNHAKNEICPFPNFVEQLLKIQYSVEMIGVQQYSIFPLFGSFYCVDCPEGNEEANVWEASIGRIRREELPKNVTLKMESFVFTCNSEYQKKSGNPSGYLYSYRIFVTEIEKITPDKENLQAKIKVISYGSRQIVREGWYKIGDVIEFSHFSHKVINIVASRELDKEIRGHKCNLIGYVELDPVAIPLDKPKLEEIEILPAPPEPPAPKPELTNEEKTEMRNWKLIYPENKTLEIQAAFINLENERVTLRKPNTDYESISLKRFSQSDQNLINNIVEQRKKFSTDEGIQFEIVPAAKNPDYYDEEKSVLKQVIGEPINLSLKISNISDFAILVFKPKLLDYNSYELTKGYFKDMKQKRKNKITLETLGNIHNWIKLKPKEEYYCEIPQKLFSQWELPVSDTDTNFSRVGFYLFIYNYNCLDMPLDMRKKLMENIVNAKIFIGKKYTTLDSQSIQFVPPPIEMKELLLQKSVKYIERTFSKNEVAEILKQNDGVDVYSENAKDQIKVFLQLYSLSPNELEKLLIKYSDIEGFDRMESVYRKLSMFNSDESKQTREKMKSVALEKYKKELTDSPIETINTDDNNENDLINLSDQSVTNSKDNSSKFWIVLIISCFIVTIILVAVIIFRKRKSSQTIPESKS